MREDGTMETGYLWQQVQLALVRELDSPGFEDWEQGLDPYWTRAREWFFCERFLCMSFCDREECYAETVNYRSSVNLSADWLKATWILKRTEPCQSHWRHLILLATKKSITINPTLSTWQCLIKSTSLTSERGSSSSRDYFFCNPSPKYSTNAQAHIQSLNEDPFR